MVEQPVPERPRRAAELLWGDGGDGDDAGRSRLSLARIVAVAVEIADADGLAGLSMRRIAERLGFTTMSLYRYVPGRAELVELMRDAVFGEPVPATPASAPDSAPAPDSATDPAPAPDSAPAPYPAAGGDWRGDLEGWARVYWIRHLRHPWLAQTAGSRRLPGPNLLADYDRALGIARRTGLRATEVVAVVALVEGFVETAARQVHDVLREERESGVSHEQWWRGQDELFARMDGYPALRGLSEAGGFDEFEDPFDFGLARTLDGVELLVRTRRDENGDEKPAAAGRPCPVCGTPLGEATRGRPRGYCSQACRQRAYRRRRPATTG